MQTKFIRCIRAETFCARIIAIVIVIEPGDVPVDVEKLR